MKYFDELKRSMEWLATHERVLFMGQAVAEPGTGMSNTLKDIDRSKLLELPVAEDMQMGMTLGMALSGHIPVSIYPRWNFLLCATNQLVSHLDKVSAMSDYKVKTIIRTSIGSERPLHPQAQHVGDFTDAFKLMCKTVDIIKLENPEDVFPAYELALLRDDNRSTIIVEYGDYYNEK